MSNILENLMSRSQMTSKFKVTQWVKHPIDSHPFRSMSMGPPILEIRLFQNFTLKIYAQGHIQHHIVGPTSYQPTLLSMSMDPPPIPEIWVFKNLTLKIHGQGHGWGKNLVGLTSYWPAFSLFHVKSALPFLTYGCLKIWPWQVKVT